MEISTEKITDDKQCQGHPEDESKITEVGTITSFKCLGA